MYGRAKVVLEIWKESSRFGKSLQVRLSDVEAVVADELVEDVHEAARRLRTGKVRLGSDGVRVLDVVVHGLLNVTFTFF